MVVRFPSEPDGAGRPSGAGLSSEEGRLAPVIPLRPTAGSTASSSEKPSRLARRAATADRPRPVAALGGGQRVVEQGAGEQRVGEQASGERWNNTWGRDERPVGRRSRSDGGAPVMGDPVMGVPESDDEATRLAEKSAAVAIRQLARRGMSRWELEQLLIKREIDPEIFTPELDRLQAMGLIDDASLAASVAFALHNRKGRGRTAIVQDLTRRHIDPELIDAALADIADEDELARATELATKRIAQLSSYDDETVRRRLHGYLSRKGYDSSTVRQAMDTAFASRRHRGVRFQ